jgi:hypothetical protein
MIRTKPPRWAAWSARSKAAFPHAGEVVMLEPIGLRMEVVASTDRRVERLRVFPPAIETASSAAN